MMLGLSLLVVAVATLTTASAATQQVDIPEHGGPIVLIPGLTASELHVKKHMTWGAGLCYWHKMAPPKKVWIDAARLPCWISELSLVYDEKTKRYHDRKGVEIVVENFGHTAAVENLGTNLQQVAAYRGLIQYFVDRGYTRGKDFKAAPYDWRYAAKELELRGYFLDLKNLISSTVREYKRKINLVASSMGGPVSHYFLTKFTDIDQEWKDEHIENYIILAGAWTGGENTALQVAISGMTLDIPLFPWIEEFAEHQVDTLVNTFQSPYWLLPNSAIWGKETLVTTKFRNYTADDFEQLFIDTGNTFGYEKYKEVKDLNYENGKQPSPKVPTHCFYGSNRDTPVSFDYSDCKHFPDCQDDDIKINMDPQGDTLVNSKGAKVCLDWADSNNDYTFESQKFNLDHFQMINDDKVLKAVGRIIGAPDDPLPEPHRFSFSQQDEYEEVVDWPDVDHRDEL